MNTDIPKTAIIGASGFLGRYFLPAYRKIYPDCIATVKNGSVEDQHMYDLDLYKPNIAGLQLAKRHYKEALIFAAITRVNITEKEKVEVRKANVDGTFELIRQLTEEGVKPVFFSSSYVFDGKTGSYTDQSPVNPIIEYGKQKAEVEAQISAITKENFLVIRLCKIFSLVKEDKTFLDEIAGILSSGGTYRAAYDQIFCPTLVTDVIAAVSLLQSQGSTGIINVCSPEVWSRYDLAIVLARLMGVSTDKVIRASLDEIMISPRYPKNTSMISGIVLKPVSDFTPISICLEQTARHWTNQILKTNKQ
ncbi:MAG: sugar nucleotide-binding protein [Candidatus Omnitrophica bacterium]|nr:sugar nucleotide-binding protein [Candidatus Omnitrophota bacterium]